jgi:hypothetical protein
MFSKAFICVHWREYEPRRVRGRPLWLAWNRQPRDHNSRVLSGISMVLAPTSRADYIKQAH